MARWTSRKEAGSAAELAYPRPSGEAGVADPYPAFEALAAAGPLHKLELTRGFEAWVVTRFSEVQAALSDPSRLSSSPGNAPAGWHKHFGLTRDDKGDSTITTITENLILSDPPAHARLRKLVSRAFTPRRVAALRPRLEEITGELIDTIVLKGSAELIADYTSLIPLTVICELLGVPEADRTRFHERSLTLVGVISGEPVAPEEALDARRNIVGYLTNLVAEKRLQKGDDIISALIDARDEGDKLSDTELVSMSVEMLLAGQETTSSMIGNALLFLMRHPERAEELRRRPDLVPAAVEEFLRMFGTLHGTWRFSVEDVEIGGTVIPAGETVLVLMSAAGRDADRFPDPNAYDPGGSRPPHVAFGHGIHHCLGSALARLEAQVAIAAAVNRIPDLTLAVPTNDLRWRPSPFMRSLVELPVTVTRRRNEPRSSTSSTPA